MLAAGTMLLGLVSEKKQEHGGDCELIQNGLYDVALAACDHYEASAVEVALREALEEIDGLSFVKPGMRVADHDFRTELPEKLHEGAAPLKDRRELIAYLKSLAV